MSDWKSVLNHLVADAENTMDALRYRLHDKLGGPGAIKILPYRGYGSPARLYLRGRVLEDKHIPEAEHNDNLWENLVNMYKRMESDEIPHARLVARFQGQEKEVVADEEGYFDVWMEPSEPFKPTQIWQTIELELVDPLPGGKENGPVKATGEVLVPPPTAKYVVVSDIDDTVMHSDVTHLVKMARNVFLGNAYTRLPFPGVAALYRALFAGKSGAEMNPLFFVSSSPWNLYDLLSQFFNLQGIPVGPVLLRDWGVTEQELLPVKNKAYKIGVIRQMLDFYPGMPFILIGDSSQEDPEIYSDLVREYPRRVQAVYIRNVTRNLSRPQEIQSLARGVLETGSALVLADDSVAIARHAIQQGFIAADALAAVQEDRRKDTAPPSALDQLLGEPGQPEAPTVTVGGESPTAARKEVQAGAVETTVKEEGKEETKAPPTVVVESKEAKQRKEE